MYLGMARQSLLLKMNNPWEEHYGQLLECRNGGRTDSPWSGDVAGGQVTDIRRDLWGIWATRATPGGLGRGKFDELVGADPFSAIVEAFGLC